MINNIKIIKKIIKFIRLIREKKIETVKNFSSESFAQSEDEIIKRRLRSLGLIRGRKIKIVKEAPLGDPIQIDLGDYDLILSKSVMKKLNLVSCGKNIYEIK